jgi:hypothetical protein
MESLKRSIEETLRVPLSDAEHQLLWRKYAESDDYMVPRDIEYLLQDIVDTMASKIHSMIQKELLSLFYPDTLAGMVADEYVLQPHLTSSPALSFTHPFPSFLPTVHPRTSASSR